MPTSSTSSAPENIDVVRLRTRAMNAISGHDTFTLSDILKEIGDPRLLDVPCTADEWQDSLLEWAVREGSVDCALKLLATGADPMHTTFESGFCSLHILASHAKNMDGRTMRRFVGMLGAAGADFDVKTDLGWTPLHFAINDGSPEFVEILIEHGVWVDPKLLDDPNMETQILPDPVEEHRPQSVEALRLLRALVIEQNVLSAMPTEPGQDTPPSPGMTL